MTYLVTVANQTTHFPNLFVVLVSKIWCGAGDLTKQLFWDRPGVLEDKTLVEATLSSAYHRASFLAASTQHSGDWLFAIPIASCGLTLDDEAVRVAVGLRLGLDLCEPHQCQCSHVVDARGLSFVCKRASGSWSARHHALNDLVARSPAAAGVPVTRAYVRVVQGGRETTGWPYTRPLAKREVAVLGCYGDLPSGSLLSVELLVRQVQQLR